MNETKATRYQRLKRRAHVADVASGVILLVALALTPLGRVIAGWAYALAAPWPLPLQWPCAVVVFVGVTVLLWEAVALPAVLYLSLRVDRRFKGTDASVEGVVGAQAQATLVALTAAMVAATAIAFAVWLAGMWWWIAAGAMLAVALVGAARALPDLLVRVGEVRPVARRTLLTRLREVARRSDVPVSDILEWQIGGPAATSALLTGLGRTRRVFVGSDMMRNWSDDEIVVVVAHELAHHVHRDLWRTLALNAGVLSLGLWIADIVIARTGGGLALAGAGDLAAWPLIALVAGAVWMATTPVRHAQSRVHERRADRFALRLTGEAEAFGAAIRRLSAQHLAEERPSPVIRWLFHRHPTVAERLQIAAEFATAATFSLRR
jgi:Zn-dependent protease with chaperone function